MRGWDRLGRPGRRTRERRAKSNSVSQTPNHQRLHNRTSHGFSGFRNRHHPQRKAFSLALRSNKDVHRQQQPSGAKPFWSVKADDIRKPEEPPKPQGVRLGDARKLTEDEKLAELEGKGKKKRNRTRRERSGEGGIAE
jgi:hypothetical protein